MSDSRPRLWRNRPSRYRWLKPLPLALAAAVLWLVAYLWIDTICGMGLREALPGSCVDTPAWPYQAAAIALIIFALAASLVRYYKDFMLDEYQSDLAEWVATSRME